MRKVATALIHGLLPAGLLCCAALTASVALAAPTTVRPLELKDAILTKGFALQTDAAVVSPDGRWIAYMLADEQRPTKADDDGDDYSKTGVQWNDVGGNVWLTNVATGEAKNLTAGKGTSWNPSWSPDGKTLAFFSDRDGAARLWVWDRDTGATRRVSERPVRSFFSWAGVRWLPDNRHIILYVLPDGYTVARANEELDARVAAKAAKVPANTSSNQAKDGIFPGSSVSVYKNHAGEAAAAAAPKASGTAGGVPIVIEPVKGPTRYFGEVVVMELQTGKIVRRLTQGLSVSHYRLSPDGKQLSVAWRVGSVKNSQEGVSNISVIDVASGKSRIVAQNIPLSFGTTVSWSPDSSMLGYVTARKIDPSGLFVVKVSGGEPRQLGTVGQPDFRNEVRPPLWSPGSDALFAVSKDRQLWKGDLKTGKVSRVAADFGRAMMYVVADASGQRVWSPDGRSAYVEFRDSVKATVGIAKIDMASGRATVLRDEARNYGDIFQRAQVSADGKTVVYVAQDAQHEPNIWVAGVDYAGAKQLTHINPELDKYVFGAGQIIEFKNTRGESLRGALLLPAGYEKGKRYPLLTRMYPGPYKQADKVNEFGLEGTGFSNMQMFATRGYAVFFPEAPQRLGTPMKDMADDVLPAIDKVIELGIADPNRLGVFGQSYGGYSTIAMLVQTNRFKGAMMSAGQGDLISGYGQFNDGRAGGIGWSETGQGLMGGSPWQYRDRYIENSPIFYLDKVTTPLLIIHGDRDTAVPVWQGDAIFVGLRRLGKEVEYRRYQGEEHTIRSLENMSDYWTAAIRWFDTHVKNAKSNPVAQVTHD